MPATVAVGFWLVEAKAFGPLQLQPTLLVGEAPFRIKDGMAQVKVPAVAVAPGSMMFWLTVTSALALQPLEVTTVRLYLPGVLTVKFGWSEVKLLGPVQAML